jgi:deazaflavin-dependent oxidoreductase (nitroreductase family)
MTELHDPTVDRVQKINEHKALYLSDPANAHMWDARHVGLPGEVTTLLLTMIGRSTGTPRHVPLIYVDDADGYLVIASKGGMDNHPIWYLNLLANPQCEISVGAPPVKAIATTLEGAERKRAWSKIVDRHFIYGIYQTRTKRQIPVVRLLPSKN